MIKNNMNFGKTSQEHDVEMKEYFLKESQLSAQMLEEAGRRNVQWNQEVLEASKPVRQWDSNVREIK